MGIEVSTDVSSRARELAISIAVALLSAAAGFAAIYVTVGGGDNAGSPDRSTLLPGQAAKPGPATADGGRLNSGAMAAFVFKATPEPLAEVAFKDGKDRELTLKHWQGRVVLLNLWATWCAPCRKEMPELDRLQAELGSDRFEVVALAVDRAGAEGARKFLAETGVKSLALYVDPAARAGTQLKTIGLPTTILIDREGREVGRLTGPAVWDSAEAKRLIRAVVGE
jgi:thiol-disulfide isomerase/thioredoxin